MTETACKKCRERESLSCDECDVQAKHFTHVAAQRLDLWKMARSALTNDENTWPEDAAPLPADILNLTLYLDSGADPFSGSG